MTWSDLTWSDQSASGEILEWRPHLLSREMELLGLPHLAASPTVRTVGEARHRLLATEMTPDGVCWTWGAFSRLRLELCADQGFPLFADDPISWLAHDRTELRWADLPPCDALELTPFDAAGNAGATVRISRPPGEPWIPFTFRYLSGRRPGVRLTPRPGTPPERLDRLESLEGVALMQEGHDRFRRLRPVVLERSGGIVPVPESFGGIVAVVGIASGCRRLLDCTTVFELDERGRPGPESREWAVARRETSSGGRVGQAWPARTQRSLDALFQAASAADVAAYRLRIDNLPGLHRSLVLRACRLAVAPEVLADIPSFAGEASLDDSLRRLTPRLLPLLKNATGPEARLWLTAHADHSRLEAIAEWAADNAGPEPLARARELIGYRTTLQQLAAKVRPDCDEGKEIAALLAEVEPYPRTGWRPADLDGRLEKLQRRIRESREVPPINRDQYKAWLEAQKRSRSWRSGVETVLTFCERGEWPASSAPALSDLTVLRDRAQRLAPPVEVPEAAPGPDDERLAALVEEARHRLDWEPPSRERDEILSLLAAAVLPKPALWSSLHRLLRRAREEAGRWPVLAGELGLPGAPAGLGEQARRARLLIELIEGSRQVALRHASHFPIEATELREVLATPKHPEILRVYQECRGLAHRLAEDGGLPPAPPHAPAAPTRKAFREWWQAIVDLYAVWAGLQQRAKDLERHLEFARTSILPLAQSRALRLAALPDGAGSADDCDFLAALHDFEDAGREVPARVYHRFLEVWRKLEGTA